MDFRIIGESDKRVTASPTHANDLDWRSSGRGEMKFRKKPLVIEAIQFESNYSKLVEFVGEQLTYNTLQRKAFISTLEGTMEASLGDWIVKGVKGEFYPIKDVIFRETYEREDGSAI